MEAVRILTVGRGRLDRLAVAGRAVEPHDIAPLRFGVDGIGVGRIDLLVHPIAEVDLIPVGVQDADVAARGAGAAPRVRVLQPAVDDVRDLHVNADGIELS